MLFLVRCFQLTLNSYEQFTHKSYTFFYLYSKSDIMSNKTIGVTGASGFIGRRIVEMGMERGYKMIAFVRPTSDYPKEWDEKISIIKGDIVNPEDLKEFVERSDIIIHQAAVVIDWAKREHYQKVSVNGTKYLLDHMIGTDKKIVLASSISVYSSQIPKGNCTEEIVLPPPIGNYSWSKQEQEKLVQYYAKEHDIKFSIIRPGNVYGPYARTWVHEYIKAMKKGPSLIGGGHHSALTYIDNVADIFLKASLNDVANGQTYNATDDNELTWREYGNKIAETLGMKKPKAIPILAAKIMAGFLEFFYKVFKISTRPQITREALCFAGYEFDMPYKKASDELNYKPLVNKTEGLKRTLDYLRRAFND